MSTRLASSAWVSVKDLSLRHRKHGLLGIPAAVLRDSPHPLRGELGDLLQLVFGNLLPVAGNRVGGAYGGAGRHDGDVGCERDERAGGRSPCALWADVGNDGNIGVHDGGHYLLRRVEQPSRRVQLDDARLSARGLGMCDAALDVLRHHGDNRALDLNQDHRGLSGGRGCAWQRYRRRQCQQEQGTEPQCPHVIYPQPRL